jgi:predicted translin family RNA/ssDNA-binding protein
VRLVAGQAPLVGDGGLPPKRMPSIHRVDADDRTEIIRLHRLIDRYARAAHTAALKGRIDEAGALFDKMSDPVQQLRNLYERILKGLGSS